MVIGAVSLFFPSHEGQGGVPTRQSGKALASFQHMGVDGPRRQVQQTGDLLVSEVTGDKAEDFALTRGQCVEPQSSPFLRHDCCPPASKLVSLNREAW